MSTNNRNNDPVYLLGLVTAGFFALSGLRKLYSMLNRLPLPSTGDRKGSALVTGASSGLGAEYARQLAGLGYDLILAARRKERLDALGSELTAQYGVHCESLVADLSKEAGIASVERRIAAAEDLVFLVNNAGFSIPGSFHKAEPQFLLDMLHVHVESSVRLTRAALPGMVARQQGAVINMASVAAFVPLSDNSIYSSAKAYLVNFSLSLRNNLRGSGVKVQALCPGFTRTELLKTARNHRLLQTPSFFLYEPDFVVRESLKYLERDDPICIPGMFYKAVSFVARDPLMSPWLNDAAALVLRTLRR